MADESTTTTTEATTPTTPDVPVMTNVITRTVDPKRAILQVSQEIAADGSVRMNPVVSLTVLEDGSCVSSRVNTETLFTPEQNLALYQMFLAMAVQAGTDNGFTVKAS
jgi:hypothetical protein